MISGSIEITPLSVPMNNSYLLILNYNTVIGLLMFSFLINSYVCRSYTNRIPSSHPKYNNLSLGKVIKEVIV